LATVLTDVCYRLYAYVYQARNKDTLPDLARAWDKNTSSPGHAYAAIFERRLKNGKWFTMPFLGWKEFTPSYLGPLREDTKVETCINMVLPSMVREVFPDGYNSQPRFTYEQNVRIEDGVLHYRLKGRGVEHD
jgi:CRISPR-associated protein Cas5d